MKTKLEIFSPEKLKDFLLNINEYFELRIRSLGDLEKYFDDKSLSLIFVDQNNLATLHILKDEVKTKCHVCM